MMPYRWLLSLSVLCGALCSGACAHQKSPEELRREAQRAQLQRAAPAELDDDGRTWRAYKTVRARFYYDPTFAQLEGNVHQHIEDRVNRVNAVLEGALHARIAGGKNRDATALSADDQKRLAELDAKQASGDTHGAYGGLTELADKNPHTHFLQHEACETGMRLRRSFKEISRYCDRVAAAAAPAAP
jgi:hypothetical protein